MPIRSATPTSNAHRARGPVVDSRTGSQAHVAEAKRRGDGDAFEHGASSIAPFAEHYAASKHAPSLPKGKPTIDTFDEPQMRALHRAYWSAPATASLGEMLAIAWKDPAFKGRKLDSSGERAAGRLFEKLPDSFPWGWRSRSLAATSCLLIDALVKAPKGTSVLSVVTALQRAHKDFPTVPAFIRAAKEVWPKEPDRFPFAKHLPRDGAGKAAPFKLEAVGSTETLDPIRKDKLGRFVMTKELAEKVRDLSMSPAFEYGWTREQFAKFVDGELKGGGAFTESTWKSARAAFPDIVPDFMAARAARRERIAQTIHDLYHHEGITSADGIIRALHERHGTPLWKRPMLTTFRNEFPTLVPDFKLEQELQAYSCARHVLDEIVARPDEPRLHVAMSLGYSAERAKELLHLAAKAWPDELDVNASTRFSDDDVRMLRQAMADVPLNATMRDVMSTLQREHPQFLERHPYSSPESLYAGAVLPHGGLGTGEENRWRALQQQRYVEVFVDVVNRSPPGTPLTEIVNTILDDHDGAYTHSHVSNLLAKVRSSKGSKDVPPSLAKLAALRDKDGAWPWDKGKVKLTRALAERVAAEIERRPGHSIRAVAVALMKDAAFAKEHPTFSADTIHNLRAVHPKVVPYRDDPPPTATHERRVDAQRRELTKVAKQIAKHISAEGTEASGLTIAHLARTLKMRPHRVLAAVRHEPALFPWYRERPSGRVDLYLATKVAHAIESAPLGTTLEQVVDALRGDKTFRARYPQFNYFSVTKLRERYPEIVPEVHARNQILRSKLLIDALTTAKKGASYATVFAALSKEHPGQFPEKWASEDYVKALWKSEPERFPFAKGFSKGPLVGRGAKLAPETRSDAELASQLAKLEQIPDNLAVLDKIVDGLVSAKSKPFANTEILAIQHLLGPQVAMFDAARKLGMAPGRSSIVGIPYSVSDTVVSTLEDKGFEVRVPPLDLEAWYGMVKDAMEDRIAAALKHGRKIVVFDDGGLVPMMFERWPHLAEHAHLFRIVEQTTRGITVADGVDLHSPVVNVAQSWAKFVEGPMVGSTVQQKLLKRLAGIGVDDIKGKHIGVNGFGTIGAPLAEFLRSQGAIVTIMDLGEDAQKRARAAGFDVVDGNDKKARAKFYGKQDILVGATGKQSMTAEDIEHMKDGAILGSSSSKLVEIDVETLKALAKKGRIEVVDAESFPPTVRYHMKDGRTIDLLASGFPMNFDGSVEDVAAERIQLTMGLMLAGALQAAGVSAAGLHRLDPSIQLELIRAFHDDVGGSLDDAQGEAVAGAMSLAQTHLRELQKKHGARDHDLRHRR